MKTRDLKKTIEAVEKAQPILNASVTIVKDDEPTATGRLANVPVAIKDNFSTKGIRTTASSRILDNYIPVFSATAVERLKNEGAVIVAKTAMDELGMGGTGKNAYTGPIHNPYDRTRISGGSSGGSAALVGAGLVDLALGSDTGDSIRKPAAYCGAVGFKPTYGRISRYGVIPYASSMDHVGFFTGNVEDAALALEILSGRDDLDMTSSFEAVPAYQAMLDGDLSNTTIGVFTTVLDHLEDQVIKSRIEQIIEDLKARGARIVDVEMPVEYMELIAPVYKTIANAEATANHSNLDGLRFGMREPGESVEEVMKNSRTKGFSDYVRARFVIGSYSLFEENQDRLFRKAQKIRRLLVDSYARMFEKCDVVLAPAAPTVAPKLDESAPLRFGKDEFIEEHMQLGNFSGYPSITIPIGFEDGLPFALNLSARPFEEQALLNTALAVEQIAQFDALKEQYLPEEFRG